MPLMLDTAEFVAVGHMLASDDQKAVRPESEDVVPEDENILAMQPGVFAMLRKILVQRPLQIGRVGIETWKDIASSSFGVSQALAEERIANMKVSTEVVSLTMIYQTGFTSSIEKE